MQALETLGLKLKEQIGLEELLSENFNPQLYSLTRSQEEKISALRDVVAAYVSIREDITGKIIKDSQQAAQIAGDRLRRLEHEEFWVAFLNRANVVLSFEMVFKGSVDNVLISPRVILAKALSLDATNIILYHNHPSGSVMPSASDIKMTANLKKACTLLEVNLLDHLIISRQECYSFADEASFKIKK